MRVFVLDCHKQPLMPTHPAKARKLLAAGQAAVNRRYPFTIVLKYPVAEPKTQPLELKLDPGSKTTGRSLVAQVTRGRVALWVADLHYRGQQVKRHLESRRACHRNHRNRKTRYRPARFNNRTRPVGYEVRQYLLEKWGRKCAYCGAKDTPLEVEHLVRKFRGGSNRVSNLTLACQP